MSTTPASTRPSAAPSAPFLARRPVWQVSYLSGLAASVAVETWGLAARAVGAPMRAAGVGDLALELRQWPPAAGGEGLKPVGQARRNAAGVA